jgi:hypothetical protein
MKTIAWVGLGIACAAAVSAPLANADSGPKYFKTAWGTRCQVSANDVVCDTCEPGLLLDTAYGAAYCGRGPENDEHIVGTSGVEQQSSSPGILGSSPDLQQLVFGQTYHANGWTVTMPISSVGVHFTNDATGHGMAVAPQNYYMF